MSFWHLLRHQAQTYWRVPFFGRRIFSLILGGLSFLYVGAMLVLLGLLFDDLIGEFASDTDPLDLASRWLIPLGLGYTALRVVMETGIGFDPDPYLHLPIRRDVLVIFFAVSVLLSAWNALPMIFLVTICGEAAVSGLIGEALRFGLSSLGLLIAATYLAPILRKELSNRPFVSIGLIIIGAGSVSIEVVDSVIGSTSLLSASGWLIGGVVRGQILPTWTFLALLTGIGSGYLRWLQERLPLDARGQRISPVSRYGDLLSRVIQCGPAWREAVLETRLLLRNSQTQLTLLNVFLFVGLVGLFGVIPLELSQLQSPMTTLFPGLFGTGGFIIWHGQNLFSYESRYFEGSMARPVSAWSRVAGKLLFLEAGTLLCFLLPLPILLWARSPFLLVHTAFLFYNAGLLAPAVLAGAMFNRKALSISEVTLSQNNFSGARIAVFLPLLGLPMVPILLVNPVLPRFGAIATLGLLSTFAYPLWRRGLTILYRRNRHAMARGFRASGD